MMYSLLLASLFFTAPPSLDEVHHLLAEHFEEAPPAPLKIAFWNLLSTHVTDQKPSIATAYPQYRWENRKKAMIELIAEERPALLGFCELDLRQTQSFHEACLPGGPLEGYRLVGYSSETHQSIEEVAATFPIEAQTQYGEFVGLLFDTRQLTLTASHCHPLPHFPEQRWNRILVEAELLDATTPFTCLISHFDHQSQEARQASAHFELEKIRHLAAQERPWISLGDRNWQKGEEEIYLHEPHLLDWREGALLGLFGPPGTFPGHLWLHEEIPILHPPGEPPVIAARTLDTGYYDPRLSLLIYSYSRTGEFDPHTGELLPSGESRDLASRTFASDHYYVASLFLLAPFKPKPLSRK